MGDTPPVPLEDSLEEAWEKVGKLSKYTIIDTVGKGAYG